MPFSRVTDQELACIYLALLSYALSSDAAVWLCGEFPRGGDTAEANPLYSVGHQAHQEIHRRGRARFGALLPSDVGFPFESWEHFCRAVHEASGRR